MQLFYRDPISFPLHQPRRLTNAWSHVEEADTGRRRWYFLSNKRSTSGSVSSVLICHKCLLFPMAKDKGQRTYEEHAFLMWHSHQIHHSGLSRMPMTLYSSSNYSETMQQYECKPWRAHLPLTWRSLNSSALHLLWAWTCDLYFDIGVMFDYGITCFSGRKASIRRAH